MAVVSSARDYPIKSLLLNFAENTQDLTEKEYKSVLTQLVVGLLHIPISRIACISPHVSIREERIKSSFEEIKSDIDLPLEFEFFPGRWQGLQWLLEKKEV